MIKIKIPLIFRMKSLNSQFLNIRKDLESRFKGEIREEI